jgi:hypothetical protein
VKEASQPFQVQLITCYSEVNMQCEKGICPSEMGAYHFWPKTFVYGPEQMFSVPGSI